MGHPSISHPSSAAGAAAPAAGPVTVLTVDDQEIFRRVVRELIAATPGFEQVGEAASGEEALGLASSVRPDLVLLDVRMPGMDGVETARGLARATPESVVVFMSVEPLIDLPGAVGAAPHLRKQDLSPRVLHDVWTAHRAARGRG